MCSSYAIVQSYKEYDALSKLTQTKMSVSNFVANSYYLQCMLNYRDFIVALLIAS